jgi:5-methylcytosine-specific restriction endonuclease McrA
MTNTNTRGSSYARRVRKQWLLNVCGDGTSAPCWECLALVTYETMVVDRITPQAEGGTYQRNNIRVHCKPCSDKQGSQIRDRRKS